MLGWSAAGLTLGATIGSCGGGTTTSPVVIAPTGRVGGVVTDLIGARQPSLGRIFLLYPTGQHTGRYVDVDPAGQFEFLEVPPGPWQVRFHAPGVAYVPEPIEHPIRFSVAVDKETIVPVQIEHGIEQDAMHEIYVGDYFFQEQPYGKENAETVVRLGESVCWYNVGLEKHTVTGGPWGDSGVIGRAGNYIWVPDRVGVIGYRCAFHPGQMFATLKVTA